MDKSTALDLLKSLQAQQAALAQQQAALLAALAGDPAPLSMPAPPAPPPAKKGRRRSRTPGSIEQLPNGRWRARIELEADPRTGKRKGKSKVYDTQKGAAEWLHRELLKRKDGTITAPCRVTFAAHIDEWLKTVVYTSTDTTERTKQNVRVMLRYYVLKDLGEVRLEAITPALLQAHVATLQGRNLSPRTIRGAFVPIKMALACAVDWGRITVNPSQRVKLPKIKREMKPAFEPAKVRAFLQDVAAGPYGTLLVVAVLSGMRPGEQQALMWDCVDFEASSVKVLRGMEWLRGEKALGTRMRWNVSLTKNESSARTTVLPEWVMAMLREHKAEQDAHRARLADLYTDHGFVFCTPFGTPFISSKIAFRLLKPALARHGLPALTYYQIRRIAPSLLMAAGKSPQMAAERLGHSNITTTLSTYTHESPGMQQEAADTLGDMLHPRKKRLSHTRPMGLIPKHGTP